MAPPPYAKLENGGFDMRYLFLLVFLAGCTAAPVLTVQDRAGLGAYLAMQAVGRDSPSPPAPAPQPNPGPEPAPAPSGDICQECQGKGKVGDGVVMFTCDACGGTGRAKTIAPPPPPPSAAVVPAGPRWSVAGKWNYTTVELADHLRRSHGVDVNGKTRSQLEAIHNAIHNGQAAPRSTRACPTGKCPIR